MIMLQFDDVWEARFSELPPVEGFDAVFVSVRNVMTVNLPTAPRGKLEKITTTNYVNPSEELFGSPLSRHNRSSNRLSIWGVTMLNSSIMRLSTSDQALIWSKVGCGGSILTPLPNAACSVHSFDEHSRYKRRSTYNGGGDRIPTPREILEAFDDSGFSRSTRSSKKHHQVTISWKSTI
jgi:hypothetical protein